MFRGIGIVTSWSYTTFLGTLLFFSARDGRIMRMVSAVTLVVGVITVMVGVIAVVVTSGAARIAFMSRCVRIVRSSIRR
jgi:hypothetical protein